MVFDLTKVEHIPVVNTPVARIDTVRVFISLASKCNWRIYYNQVNILNGVLEQEIYMNNLQDM